MNKIYESKFMKGLQKFGEKLGSNKVFSAISKSMMGTMAIILVGAIFQIVATVPTLFGWYTMDSAIYQTLYAPYNMTMGILSVFVAFMIAYNYAKSLNMKPMQNGIVALICFLIIAAPATTVTLADGLTTMTVLNNSYLGASGLFVAIIIGILTVNLTHFCEKKNIVIKMPDVVPSFLSEAFSAMLPLLFNIIIWYGIGTALSALTQGQMNLPLLITYLLSLPLKALNTVPGILIAVLFSCVLWTFGIHGHGGVHCTYGNHHSEYHCQRRRSRRWWTTSVLRVDAFWRCSLCRRYGQYVRAGAARLAVSQIQAVESGQQSSHCPGYFQHQ